MISANSIFSNMINSSVRKIGARVELYNGSTLVSTFKHTDKLIGFDIERVGEENKFFGFGVCQKLKLRLMDVNRELDITTENTFKINFDVDNTYMNFFPTFRVSEVHRDEKTNELSITAYDALYQAAKHNYSELTVSIPTHMYNIAILCRQLLGLTGCNHNGGDIWTLSYSEDINLEGTETIREVLDAIAEATQSIYYVTHRDVLYFKKLDVAGEPVLTIDKSKYFTLDSKTNRRLATIVHATELGDNVSVSTTTTGSTQYVRNNPFWELREDIDTLLNDAIAAIGGLTINQFDCSWRGNFLLEIGDKIGLVTKDDNSVISYLLNDTITYNGSLSQQTQWSYTSNEAETASNPSTLGETLKQTYARVDKVNKQIDIVASNVDANSEAISSLQINTENITASVQQIESNTNEALETLNGDIATLTSKVEATITAEDVQLEISSALDNGVDKVITSTGFTFNEEGLTVSKSGSEMTTQITEDGMTVYKDGSAVLTANNKGVNAANLHATTYLIIGTNSRFEDYGSNRTGCFWIGG